MRLKYPATINIGHTEITLLRPPKLLKSSETDETFRMVLDTTRTMALGFVADYSIMWFDSPSAGQGWMISMNATDSSSKRARCNDSETIRSRELDSTICKATFERFEKRLVRWVASRFKAAVAKTTPAARKPRTA